MIDEAKSDDFETLGYVGITAAHGISTLRGENPDWFALADDLNHVLMRVGSTAVHSIKSSSWSADAVTARIVLRACGTFQGVILLSERGMLAESRTLVRSLIEDAFGIAAILDDAAAFLNLLKADSEASRRNQGNFILTENLITAGAYRMVRPTSQPKHSIFMSLPM